MIICNYWLVICKIIPYYTKISSIRGKLKLVKHHLHTICILRTSICIYFASFVFSFSFFIEIRVPGWTRIIKMWLHKSIAEHALRSPFMRYLFSCKETLIPIYFVCNCKYHWFTLHVSSNTRSRYVTFECWFIFLGLCVIFI